MRTQVPRTKSSATELFSTLSVREVAQLEHRRIAARIGQARKEAGLTQDQMAQLLNVVLRTYQNYEAKDEPRIPWDKMNDIERATGKKVEWLLHGETPDPFSSTGSSSDEVLKHLQMIQAALAAAAAERAAMQTQLDEIESLLKRPPSEGTG